MDGTCARGSCPLEDDARSFHFPLPPVTRLLFKPRRNLWYMCWSSMGKSRHLLSLSRCLRSLGERSLREWGASVRSPIFSCAPRFSFSHRPRPLPLYCFPDVYSDRGPMTVALLFLRPASAFMGTRCLQAHRVGYLLLVHFSSYRFPSSSPRASS